ncbi:putative acetyltransferase [Senna tora]|uniref:Putative acetyltransferase n=1 Tax=Senna tora TaxID=362788 RepID=A0A834XI55_9FABA|nr:putative acetyltransferase [Senna tora]
MGRVRVISTCAVHASTSCSNNNNNNNMSHLTPWDLQIPALAYIQRGLLFPNPKSPNHNNNIVEHLKHSLSGALDLFPPLAGRLAFQQHLHDHTFSVSILSNNAGASFVHAIAEDTTLSDILRPTYVPPFVRQFFQLITNDDEPTSKPLLEVQVTDLADGYFLACSINHCAVDGTSFWHFINCWAQISRGLHSVSNIPVLQRWFPSGVDPPIWVPTYIKQMQHRDGPTCSESWKLSEDSAERLFHFTKQNIAQLKAKANADVELNQKDNKVTRISSLQAVLSHIWRCIVRNQRHDPRRRVESAYIIMKAKEIMVEGGVGKAALEMNNMIGLYTEEMLKRSYESWAKHPFYVEHSNMKHTTVLVSSSPKFDVYANDFGWGQPIAVRCGPMIYAHGSLILFQGAEEGRRLAYQQHLHDHSSVSILCNNAGALFVHAIADDTTVSDVIHPTYVPPILQQFFQRLDAPEITSTSTPLLEVQVTELVDGLFIACSVSHCVADGTSFWHFINSWAEISRGLQALSNLPILERWFPSGVDPPIRFPSHMKQKQGFNFSRSPLSAERVFHFTKQNIAQLKAKANAELNTNNKITISSLQALISHIWRCVVGNQGHDPEADVHLILPVGVRQRIMEPPLGANYFGNAVKACFIRMKAKELLKGGVGKVGLEINKTIGLQTQEELKRYCEDWIKHPDFEKHREMRHNNTVIITSSPKFDIYGNDFGWGQPVAARCGPMIYSDGNITLLEGAEEGSIDVLVCIGYDILEAMANDSQFMDLLSL